MEICFSPPSVQEEELIGLMLFITVININTKRKNNFCSLASQHLLILIRRMYSNLSYNIIKYL